jgi:hypothetical protein
VIIRARGVLYTTGARRELTQHPKA